MLLVSGTLRLSSNQMSIFFKVLFFAYCICLISAPSRNVTVWGDEFNFETAFSSTNNESQWLVICCVFLRFSAISRSIAHEEKCPRAYQLVPQAQSVKTNVELKIFAEIQKFKF